MLGKNADQPRSRALDAALTRFDPIGFDADSLAKGQGCSPSGVGRVLGPTERQGRGADGGRRQRLHESYAGKGPSDEVDLAVVRELDATVRAAVIGRRTFDLGLNPWGGTPWPGVPSFVVTHRTREDLLGDNGGTFTFDGLEAAARRALDEVYIHLVPLLMGEGTRLFAGERTELDPGGETRRGVRDPRALQRREDLATPHAVGVANVERGHGPPCGELQRSASIRPAALACCS
jgi:dihydrofolate reductase